jgi:hypothetical protein
MVDDTFYHKKSDLLQKAVDTFRELQDLEKSVPCSEDTDSEFFRVGRTRLLELKDAVDALLPNPQELTDEEKGAFLKAWTEYGEEFLGTLEEFLKDQSYTLDRSFGYPGRPKGNPIRVPEYGDGNPVYIDIYFPRDSSGQKIFGTLKLQDLKDGITLI